MQNKKDARGIILTEESKRAFEELKRAITSEPIVLHYPDWEKPFEIHWDASSEAVAAILSQRIDQVEKVIMYASKSLTPIERKYQTYEQECLAVVWSVEVFRKEPQDNHTHRLQPCNG
jgi:hypothetical protein